MQQKERTHKVTGLNIDLGASDPEDEEGKALKKKVKAAIKRAKFVHIEARSKDLTIVGLASKSGRWLYSHEGYVPPFLGNGDEVILKVDINTGRIVGWNKPKVSDFVGTDGEKAD